MRGRSERQSAKLRARREPRLEQLRLYPYCQVRRGPYDCSGPLTCHEPWPRGRGGPIDDPRNMLTVCNEHNRLISQDATMMRWAYEHGALVHAWEGLEWLEAGGAKNRALRQRG